MNEKNMKNDTSEKIHSHCKHFSARKIKGLLKVKQDELNVKDIINTRK